MEPNEARKNIRRTGKQAWDQRPMASGEGNAGSGGFGTDGRISVCEEQGKVTGGGRSLERWWRGV